MREYLTSNRTYYVATTGDDNGDGSAARPWRTNQHAYDWCRDKLDLGGRKITIQMVGNLAGGSTLLGPMTGIKAPEDFAFHGGSPSQFIVSSPNAAFLFMAGDDARFAVQGMTLRSPGGMGVVSSEGVVKVGDLFFDEMDISLDVCSPRSMIVGIGDLFWLHRPFRSAATAECGGQINLSCNLIISGAPNFSGAFAQADLGGGIDATGAKVSHGAATGNRYGSFSNARVFTGLSKGDPAAQTFFPGDKPGGCMDGGYFQ